MTEKQRILARARHIQNTNAGEAIRLYMLAAEWRTMRPVVTIAHPCYPVHRTTGTTDES